MEIHGGVVKRVAASFIVGAVAFVAVKRLLIGHHNSVHEHDEDEEEEEERQQLTAESPHGRENTLECHLYTVHFTL